MARTSRKRKPELQTDKPARIYSAGIYGRLSVDSHNEKNDSIETQIAIAKEYISSRSDIILHDCYTDLGRTGTNFERDGFERLMQDIRMRQVDCIIVKDFSRFGRDYLEMGNYLEKIFPFLGVRFIAVTDDFDTADIKAEQDDMSVKLKNLVNEMYARDIGIKVKKSKQAKWEMGSFTGGNPPYGYRSEWIDRKKCLFVDDITSKIVRGIFALFLAGKNLKEIVVWLYENRVLRPSEYHKSGIVYQDKQDKLLEWNRGAVKWMLTNPVYMGYLVQGRTSGVDYLNKQKHDVAAADWMAKGRTHEAIVSESDFFQVAERFQKQANYCNKDGFSKVVPLERDMFEGLLFCGECNKKMTRTGSIKEFSSGDRVRIFAYKCMSSERVDELKCGKKYITFETLTDILKASLKREFALDGIKPKHLIAYRRQCADAKRSEINGQKDSLCLKINESNRQFSDDYLKYRFGDIEQKAFISNKQQHEERLEDYKRQQLNLENQLTSLDILTKQQEKFLHSLMKFNAKTTFDAELLKNLIKRIDVFPDARVEIQYLYNRQEVGYLDERGETK